MSPLILDHGDFPNQYKRHATMTNFEVGPAAFEDVRRLVDIEFHAFENEQTNHILSYRDYRKPAHFERAVGIYSKALTFHDTSRQHKNTGHRRSDSKFETPTPAHHVRLLKVTDIETEDIVSFTKAETTAYTLEELLGPADAGLEHEPRMNRDWFKLNEKLRRDYMGLAPHYYLGMLATRPGYQHQGAGTLLLEAILAEADQAGLEVYLEATDTAKPLYGKHGFKAVKELRFDPAAYGWRGYPVERQTAMVRGAMKEDGRRSEVRSWEVAVAQARLQL